jgi:hypothetical protein
MKRSARPHDFDRPQKGQHDSHCFYGSLRVALIAGRFVLLRRRRVLKLLDTRDDFLELVAELAKAPA